MSNQVDTIRGNPNKLRRLSNAKFEALVLEILEQHGFAVGHSSSGDLIGHGPTGERTLVRIKHTKASSRLGLLEIREFYHTIAESPDIQTGLVITRSEFTKAAK
jgi:hypothetical protein